MAWVRYDDQFPLNGKVTAVIAEDPGALALQLLANTWSNTTRHPGYVPQHQPGILVADRPLGAKWADVLVRAGLFHLRGQECEECEEEYAGLPADKVTGFVIHNAKTYRAPGRERTTPGTSAELSEKRREAGRRGGKVSASRRQANGGQQNQANEANPSNVEANSAPAPATSEAGKRERKSATLRPAKTEASGQANGVSKTSTLLVAGVSPVPDPVTTSASNEAEAPTRQGAFEGMPESSTPEPTPEQHAFGVARDWIAHRRKQGTPVVGRPGVDPLHVLRRLVEPFVGNGYTDNEIKRALRDIGESIPSTSQLDRALSRNRSNEQGRRSGGLSGGNPRQLHDSHANPDRYKKTLRDTQESHGPRQG